MNKAQFELQMSRLIQNFNKQAFLPERVHLIWLEVKDEDGEWFTTCVNQFIGDFRSPPVVSDFRQAVSLERMKRYEKNKFKEPTHWEEPNDPQMKCYSCENTGLRFVKRMDSGKEYEYVYRCACSFGEKKSKRYPVLRPG